MGDDARTKQDRDRDRARLRGSLIISSTHPGTSSASSIPMNVCLLPNHLHMQRLHREEVPWKLWKSFGGSEVDTCPPLATEVDLSPLGIAICPPNPRKFMHPSHPHTPHFPTHCSTPEAVVVGPGLGREELTARRVVPRGIQLPGVSREVEDLHEPLQDVRLQLCMPGLQRGLSCRLHFLHLSWAGHPLVSQEVSGSWRYPGQDRSQCSQTLNP